MFTRARHFRLDPPAALLMAAVFAGSVAAQSFPLSDTPLIVARPLDPNVVLTLDDSETMRNAFAPDGAFPSRAAAGARRFKAAVFNPLYYNPSVLYVVPPHASAVGTRFDAALVNGFDATRGAIDLSVAYRPTYSYEPTAVAAYTTTAGHVAADHASADLVLLGGVAVSAPAAAYYYAYDVTQPGCTASTADDNCYRLQIVSATSGPGGADERRNFAIWYSYYRTRNLTLSSAAARAMDGPAMQGVRVAFQGLNACASFAQGNLCIGLLGDAGATTANVSNLIRPFTTVVRDDLYAWLRGLPAQGAAAPLRVATARAGDYFRHSTAQSPNNPYLDQPNTAAPGQERSCRPNFHVLMAGSVYNDSDSGPYCSGAACGNADNSARSLPDTRAYSPRAPYRDNDSNTLADVAFHYWASDLRPNLADDLLPYIRDALGGSASAQYWNPKNDPARWQHMINFTVGIGLSRQLDDPNIPWSGSAFTGTGYANLLNGQPWPAAAPASSGRIYDLWHAALNSRGEFYAANAPEDVATALASAFNRTAAQASVGAALAANSTRLTTQSLLYQARFDSSDWTGRLRAININTDGSLGAAVWEATAPGNIRGWDPATPNARRIVTTKLDASGLTVGVNFDAGDSFVLGRFGGSAELINYLRGQQSNELAAGGAFRTRTVPLGDIVNSEIAFTGTEDFGYSVYGDLSPTGTSVGDDYVNYLQSTKAQRTKMLYVGANDGMLHAFDADSGSELFAFVPHALLNDAISAADPRSKLALLADPAYTHRFYVDGSPWIGDAYFGGTWHTVVAGTMGAGGKGAFALDVTAPASFDTSKVLFDLDGSTDVDLGYTLGQAVIGRLNDGHFYAIFGNGINSTRECALLYLVRLADGNVRRISTVAGNLGAGNSASACSATSNGLGRPSLHDVQAPGSSGFRVTDYVYAADQRGNIWKFDLTDSDPARWGMANGNGAPLYTALAADGTPQPITASIELGRPPDGVGNPGAAMLWFGTGRYLAAADKTSTGQQTVYGILDPAGNFGALGGGRGNLVAQSIDASTRALTTHPVQYRTTGQRVLGWFADLPATGERVISAPLLQTGRLVFATLIPPVDACDGGGGSFIQAFNPYSGGRLARSLFVSGVDGIASRVGVIRNLVYIDAGARAYLYGGGSSGNVQVEEVRPATQTGGYVRGRASWREIVKGK